MVIIITGSSKGIGRAIAQRFALRENTLLLNARNEKDLQTAADELSKTAGRVDYFAADLSKTVEVGRFAKWCIEFGAPDVLVNNAGNFVPGNIIDETEGNLQQMLDSNLLSAYNLTRALLPGMLSRNTGHIFNISSIAGLKAYEGGGSYSISKYALNGFSTNLRAELMNTGIKVTNVIPGAVHTDSWKGFDNSTGRIMEADDIARMIIACTGLSKQATVEEIIIRPQAGDL